MGRSGPGTSVGRRLIGATLAVAGLALAGSPAAAQEAPGWGVYASAGFGAGGIDGEEAAALTGRVVVARGPHHLMVRASGLLDLASDSDDPVGDLGLLYGRAVGGRWGHLLAAVGIARTSGARCRPARPDCRDEVSVGVPILGEVSFAPIGPVGLGVQAFANVNGGEVFGGVAATLRIGRVPDS